MTHNIHCGIPEYIASHSTTLMNKKFNDDCLNTHECHDIGLDRSRNSFSLLVSRCVLCLILLNWYFNVV